MPIKKLDIQSEVLNESININNPPLKIDSSGKAINSDFQLKESNETAQEQYLYKKTNIINNPFSEMKPSIETQIDKMIMQLGYQSYILQPGIDIILTMKSKMSKQTIKQPSEKKKIAARPTIKTQAPITAASIKPITLPYMPFKKPIKAVVTSAIIPSRKYDIFIEFKLSPNQNFLLAGKSNDETKTGPTVIYKTPTKTGLIAEGELETLLVTDDSDQFDSGIWLSETLQMFSQTIKGIDPSQYQIYYTDLQKKEINVFHKKTNYNNINITTNPNRSAITWVDEEKGIMYSKISSDNPKTWVKMPINYRGLSLTISNKPQIAFIVDDKILIWDETTKKAREIDNDSKLETKLSWQPNGEWIVFYKNIKKEGDNTEYSLIAYDVSNNKTYTLTDIAKLSGGKVAWLQNNKFIGYINGENQLALFDLNKIGTFTEIPVETNLEEFIIVSISNLQLYNKDNKLLFAARAYLGGITNHLTIVFGEIIGE